MQEIYLSHHGILGQKWGIRRYQNEDGTLTNAGKARYYQKELNKTEAKIAIGTARNIAFTNSKKSNENRIKRRTFNNKDITKQLNKKEILDKKVKDTRADLNKNTKYLNKLLEEINSDKNLVWASLPWEYNNYDWSKGLKDFDAYRPSVSYYQSIKGNKYFVKEATDKRKSKAGWNTNHSIRDRTPVHTEYYYINT